MKKPKGIDKYVWASIVFDCLSLSVEELDLKIKQNEQVEKELKNTTGSRIGRNNNLEELYIAKVIKNFKEKVG